MKDVAECEKFRRVLKQTMTRKSPNGETHLFKGTMRPKPLSAWREVGELKYLSSRRKEINKDALSSDERNGLSPNRLRRGCRTTTSTYF